MTAEMPTLLAPTLLRQFVSGIGWITAAMVGEKAIGLLQAILIARFLSIEDYGRYGLLFVTLGWIGAVAGLQLGLTATVEVARHRESNPVRAHAVVRLSEVVTCVTFLVVVAVICSHPEKFGAALLGGDEYGRVMAVGAFMVVIGALTGIQDCVLQGYEEFKALAVLRTVGAVAGLLFVVTFGRFGGLGGIVLALAAAAALRFVMVLVVKELRFRQHAIHLSWRQVWEARDVLWSFSLPSALSVVVNSSVVWYGTVLLAHVENGFQLVAVVTAANQWRGMLMLATSIMASVAIPMMTRLGEQGDMTALSRLHGYSMRANLAINVVAIAVLGVASEAILGIYGSEFKQGWPVFVMVVATALPAAYANVFLQYLASQRRMWQQLMYYLLMSIALLVAYWLAIAAWGAIGFAAASLAVGIVASLGLGRFLAGELRVSVTSRHA
jgi:O-antigen/teichoic acid export membrane protein